LGRAYKREYAQLAGNDRQGLIKDQRQWISSRNAQCNQPDLAETKTCIIQFTKSRLAALAQQNSQPLQLGDFRPTPIEPTSSAPSPNYLWEGWHKVPDPSHIQYKVFHDKVAALSNLSKGCSARFPLSISGKIAKVNFDSEGLMVENFLLQTDDGNRSVINIERISMFYPGMTTSDLGWIVQGLQTLLRPDWYIEGNAIPCGAGGGVLYLNKIASSSSAKPTNTTALAPPEPNTYENIAPVAESTPLSLQGGTFVIPVLINGQITLNFTIDSGAADVSIPADVVSTLIRTGTIQKSDFIGQKTYRLADGSTVPSATFLIRSLKVGNRLLENVTGSVASAEADLLLGQSFLRRFKSWSIDNARQVLVLTQ
jgi:predicted aspartyl protease